MSRVWRVWLNFVLFCVWALVRALILLGKWPLVMRGCIISSVYLLERSNITQYIGRVFIRNILMLACQVILITGELLILIALQKIYSFSLLILLNFIPFAALLLPYLFFWVLVRIRVKLFFLRVLMNLTHKLHLVPVKVILLHINVLFSAVIWWIIVMLSLLVGERLVDLVILLIQWLLLLFWVIVRLLLLMLFMPWWGWRTRAIVVLIRPLRRRLLVVRFLFLVLWNGLVVHLLLQNLMVEVLGDLLVLLRFWHRLHLLKEVQGHVGQVLLLIQLFFELCKFLLKLICLLFELFVLDLSCRFLCFFIEKLHNLRSWLNDEFLNKLNRTSFCLLKFVNGLVEAIDDVVFFDQVLLQTKVVVKEKVVLLGIRCSMEVTDLL